MTVQQLPIHMSSPMIWGLKLRRKTQTRRTSGLEDVPPGMRFVGMVIDGKNYMAKFQLGEGGFPRVMVRCPYGRPGFHLWVRESLRRVELGDVLESEFSPGPFRVEPGQVAAYVADGAPAPLERWGWKNSGIPPMFMPRHCSRFTLDLRSVTVQRLQECTEADAQEEGLERLPGGWGWPGTKVVHKTALAAYQAGWEWLNGVGSWARDPWVWKLTFDQVG